MEAKKQYIWGDSRPFYSLATYNKQKFGGRIQKISVNAGFTCPNRDGTVARGGCIYCNNQSFTPSYCVEDESITGQIEKGIAFMQKRYKRAKKFIAYFQSFSNTYAPLATLENYYQQALAHPQISGLAISTRPDCIDEPVAALLQQLAEKVIVQIELGIESTYDETLKFINRGHNYEQTRTAYQLLKNRGLHLGGHLIIGLPGESDKMILAQMDRINELPIDSIKFHQLQIVKHTKLAKIYSGDPKMFSLFTLERYLELMVQMIERLRPGIAIERLVSESPPHLKIAPDWGHIRSDQFINKIENILKVTNTWQGKNYHNQF